jgi:hypothetical protein
MAEPARVTLSGDLEGEYVVLPHRSGGVLRIAPLPVGGAPVVISLKKTCPACPSQWEGKLDDGRVVYARYRWGGLSVGVGEELEDAVDNGMSEGALFSENVGDGLDGFMSFEELRAQLSGLLEFPADLVVEGKEDWGGLFGAAANDEESDGEGVATEET